tara:strand:+ start:4180 stop:5472 length:1293 start_codon:yes stop_codon:yes gene_type:complete
MNIELKTLGDVCENISRPFDFSNHQEVVFINTGDVFDGKFLHKDYFEKEDLPGQAKKAVQREDILFSEIRPINKRFAFVDEDCDEYVVSTKFMVLKTNDEVIPKYLYHYLKCDNTIKNLQKEAESRSGTFPQITFDAISYFSIPIPTIREQERIVTFIDNIEKQIEYNQKINETLNEVARTLFKSWFIDFDPVRAKAEGRSTGLSKEVSDLFPDSFEDSELGEIPKGWSKSIITDIANRISDKYKKDEDWSNERLIDLSRMPSNSISLNSYGRGDELSTSVCKFKKYDFLFGSIRPYFYKAGICPYNGVSNTSVFILRAKKSYDREFMYFYLSSNVTFQRSVQYSEGTKMPIIKWNDFEEFPFALPNEELRKQFSSIINPVIEKIILNIDKQKVLSELRDTLLTKIISGELRIPDSEKFLRKQGFNVTDY